MFAKTAPSIQKKHRYEKRQSRRICLDPILHRTEAEVYDHKTGESFRVRTRDLNANGICFVTAEEFSADRKLQITLCDDVTGRKIGLNAWVLRSEKVKYASDWILRLGEIFPKRFRNRLWAWGVRCQFSPSITLSTTYRDYYERLLGDSYLGHIRSHKPLEVRPFVNEGTESDLMTFKVARTHQEKESAYRLIYREYCRRRYIKHQDCKMFTSIYQLLPNTITYIGLAAGEVVLTLTAILDSPIGLPMDEHFGGGLESLRKGNRRLVEFTGLAVKSEPFMRGSFTLRYANKMSALFSLFRLGLRHTLKNFDVNEAVIAIPPSYEKIYQYLCFEPLGGTESGPAWNGMSFLPLRLNLEAAADSDRAKSMSRHCLWEYFFNQSMPKEACIPNKGLSRNDIQTLFLDRSNLLTQIRPAEAERLFRYFPTLKEKITSLYWRWDSNPQPREGNGF